METEQRRLAVLRNKLENALLEFEGVIINGSRESRLSHVTNISFGHLEAQSLMTALSKDIAVSSGSACTSASMEPSYVLKALGVSDTLAFSSIRFSLGRFTTEEEIDYTIEAVKKIVLKKRELVKNNIE
jgi:cysteine desulfurase